MEQPLQYIIIGRKCRIEPGFRLDILAKMISSTAKALSQLPLTPDHLEIVEDDATDPHHLIRCGVIDELLQNASFPFSCVVLDKLVKRLIHILQLQIKSAGVIRNLSASGLQKLLPRASSIGGGWELKSQKITALLLHFLHCVCTFFTTSTNSPCFLKSTTLAADGILGSLLQDLIKTCLGRGYLRTARR